MWFHKLCIGWVWLLTTGAAPKISPDECWSTGGWSNVELKLQLVPPIFAIAVLVQTWDWRTFRKSVVIKIWLNQTLKTLVITIIKDKKRKSKTDCLHLQKHNTDWLKGSMLLCEWNCKLMEFFYMCANSSKCKYTHAKYLQRTIC